MADNPAETTPLPMEDSELFGFSLPTLEEGEEVIRQMTDKIASGGEPAIVLEALNRSEGLKEILSELVDFDFPQDWSTRDAYFAGLLTSLEAMGQLHQIRADRK